MIQEYRNYKIETAGRMYIARPVDGDQLEIFSVNPKRLRRFIDAMWAATSQVRSCGIKEDQLAAPRCLREWIASPACYIDLDEAYRRGAC